MAVSADYLTYLVDQLASFARVRSRRMFGGVGLYADDTFFALVADDILYFKVDGTNRADYVARQCEPFRPLARNPDAYSMSYFAVPPDVIEDDDELKSWARKAYKAAAAAQLVKAARKTAKKRPGKRPAKRI